MPLIAACLLVCCANSNTDPGDPPKVERTSDGDLIPYTELQDRRPVRWRETRIAEQGPLEVVDGNHIRILVSSPLDPTCLRHDIAVDETTSAVTITLFVGDIPNAAVLCPPGEIQNMYAHYDTMLIETKTPIGDRTIVDGAPEPDYD